MEDTAALIERAHAGDKKAREVLVEKNIGLVHTIVRRFLGRGYEAEDLFQIGCIGLMKSIDKFDLSLGLKFSTYAVPMILGEIKRFLRDDGMVKVSRTIKENGVKVRRAKQDLALTLQREPTLAEITKACGLTKEDVVMAIEAGAEVESLYSAAYQEDGSAVYLVDKVAAGEQGMPARSGNFCQDVEKDRLLDKIMIKQMLEHLEEGERRLIYMRYFQNKTQTQVAGILGVSQVQVSRMEKKILLRMRAEIH